MKTFLTIFIFFLAIMAQIGFPHLFLSWRGNGPNLVLVLVLLLTMWKGFGKSWPAAAATGFFMDFFSGFSFGTIGFSLVFTAFIIDWFNRKVFSEVKMETIASLTILGSLLYSFLLIGLNAFLSFVEGGGEATYLRYFEDYIFLSFPSFLGGLGINLLLAGLVFYCFKKVRLFE